MESTPRLRSSAKGGPKLVTNKHSNMSTTTTAPTSTATVPNAQPARLIDFAGMLNILNSRLTLKPEHIGQQVLLSVMGKGQFLPAGFQYAGPMGATENQFNRWIYNLKANSAYSLTRKENRELLKEALKLESAGDVAGATDLYNDYLNAVQISFSVIDRGTSPQKLAAGDMVTAIVAEVATKAGEKQIVVNDVRYKAPTQVVATKFAVTDLIGE